MGDVVSSLLFQPPPPTPVRESKLIWFETKIGTRIPAFFMEHKSRPKQTIIYSHANAEDLGSVYPWVKFLCKSLQVNVLAYDYSGYGLSRTDAPPSEENCYADIDAAYQYLTEVRQIKSSNIILYGRSLGSGPSCYLASRTSDEGSPVGGLILHAPFLSVFRVVLESGCTLYGDKFPNVDFAPGIRCPVLIIHGTLDKIVPIRHGENLLLAVAEEFRAKPLFIEGMGHNHVNSRLRPLFVERVTDYLDAHVRNNGNGSKSGWRSKVKPLNVCDMMKPISPTFKDSSSATVQYIHEDYHYDKACEDEIVRLREDYRKKRKSGCRQ
mmetsp:Transcript_31829/g.46899  ORF Transcript_31829/g.46899 Transcript_31829/m.46899 type:complete len:324 (+) Transcript_31829:276-1247(+)